MGKLRSRAKNSGRIFAPLIFKLALRLEQASWGDVSQSASEAVFVIRSAQKLFKLDAVCACLDTWLEVEASGTRVMRDEFGKVLDHSNLPASFPGASAFVRSEPISHSIEVIRRFSEDGNPPALPLASLTFGSTLIERLHGAARAAQIIESIKNEQLRGEDNDLLEYAREITLEIATGYLEAGAAGLLLLHEENSLDLPELSAFAALFNLAAYYNVPAIILCRKPVSSVGLAMLDRFCSEFYVTPSEQTANITPLPTTMPAPPIVPSGWLGISRWEMDSTVDPDTIHSLRRETLGA